MMTRGERRGPGPGAGAPEHLEEVAHLTGMGPDAEVIDLCRWAAWRWAGRLPSLLRFATPERAVTSRSARTPEPPATDSELWVDTTVVLPGGAFEMGTPASPVQRGRRARLVVASDG